MLQDLKYAIRHLARTRGWTIVVLISLMLGIGATTALFTAVNGVLLQTVAVPDPGALVRLKWTGQNDMVRSSSDYGSSEPYQGKNVRSTFSLAGFEALREANKTLTDLFAGAPLGALNVVINGEADIASSYGVTGNYFRVLGLPATTGRTLTDDDDAPAAPAVAVISHAFWRRRFGSDPQIAGRVVTINGLPVTIVGVTPASFAGIQRLAADAPDVTLPLRLDPQMNEGQRRASQPTYWWVQVMGRLKPGATVEQVRGNLEGVFQEASKAGMAAFMSGLSTEERGLSMNKSRGANLPQLVALPGSHGMYDLDSTSVRSATILTVVVVVVLLIVCANVANLLLSRATARRKELSVRLSVGATRARLVRQLLTESLVLSAIGGSLGIAVGYWGRALLPFGQTAPMDWRVFGFAAGVSVLTSVTFGLVPAFSATRLDLAGAMKETSRSVAGGRHRMSKVLLVVQVALALVLVIGAGLFLRTLQNLRTVDLGFNPDNLLMFSVNPQLNRYDAARAHQVLRALEVEVAALPGVRSVALTRSALMSGSTSTSDMFVSGETTGRQTYMMTVSPGFFRTMEIPMVMGRDFSEGDIEGAPKVAVINETAARTLFPNTSPIGRRIGFEIEQSGDIEIVGVIGDTKYANVRTAAPPTMYQPFAQQGPPRGMTVILRTTADSNGLLEPVRAAVRRVDAALPLMSMATQSEHVARRFAQERLFAQAYSLFGGLALLLACIGLFGVMSYSVARRTNEIGIRMALGADRRRVARMVLGESLWLIGIGLAMGLVTALAAGRLVKTVLFGLAPTDMATIAVAVALIGVVGMFAAYLPARRASRVDPMVALRLE